LISKAVAWKRRRPLHSLWSSLLHKHY